MIMTEPPAEAIEPGEEPVEAARRGASKEGTDTRQSLWNSSVK